MWMLGFFLTFKTRCTKQQEAGSRAGSPHSAHRRGVALLMDTYRGTGGHGFAPNSPTRPPTSGE